MSPTYYHGTDAQLSPGDVLVPGATLGRDNYGLGETGHVCVTTALGMAVLYALTAWNEGPGEMPHVYEVRPLSTPRPEGRNGEDFMVAAAVVLAETVPQPKEPTR